ncbi:MAG TPA: hypothetical protein VGO21_00230 [Candidatus Paceibacterota bacterium]|jgi:hypothetical protein|nr:hypothetical protein [Candidatus Paceibacterota bacterium]
MDIFNHLDKNNLHHAYLIEGAREELVPEVLKFVKSLGIETEGNPDFLYISTDSIKIEDARNLKSFAMEKGFGIGKNTKKIFLISANSFLLEAQNSLLKMFEEPIENTIFFLVVPDAHALLKTLVSRFYFISARQDLTEETINADKFIALPLQKRIDFIKELLVEEDENLEEEPPLGGSSSKLDSSRSKALKFLNALESALHKKLISNTSLNITYFEHFFKVREFLRMPGSSTKSLMESVALVIPDF